MNRVNFFNISTIGIKYTNMSILIIFQIIKVSNLFCIIFYYHFTYVTNIETYMKTYLRTPCKRGTNILKNYNISRYSSVTQIQGA